MRAEDLTPKEQTNVRTALKFLHRRCGTWGPLAKALHMKNTTISAVVGGHKVVSASLAFRVARFVKVTVDDVLTGKFPHPNACPMCGHCADEAAE